MMFPDDMLPSIPLKGSFPKVVFLIFCRNLLFSRFYIKLLNVSPACVLRGARLTIMDHIKPSVS